MQNLPSSKLGTKDYWDQVYERELNNHREIGDEGEIWFGEDAVEKMVEWVEEHFPLEDNETLKILDVGTGNGHLLFSLVESGYAPEAMCGIDYSASSLELCRSIAKSRGPKFAKIRFECANVLDEQEMSAIGQDFALVLDKGTYDAICLSASMAHNVSSPSAKEETKTPSELYPYRIASLLRTCGRDIKAIFLITSCNWAEVELVQHFEQANLVKHSSIKWPTFSFGGSSGAKVCTVAFELA